MLWLSFICWPFLDVPSLCLRGAYSISLLGDVGLGDFGRPSFFFPSGSQQLFDSTLRVDLCDCGRLVCSFCVVNMVFLLSWGY